MAQASFLRLKHLCVIVAVGCWLSAVLLFWATVRSEPRLLLATLLGSYFLSWGTALVFAQPPCRQVMVRFTLTTMALVLALGALELASAVGLVDFRTVLAVAGPEPGNNTDNARDPELIHIHKPYLKRVGATRGDIALALHLAGSRLYPYDVTCDRNGFRNASDLSAATVVVLGDSFVEGGLVAADDLMTATLSRLLVRTVANLGQSAYGPQQELAVLRRYARSSASGRSMKGTTSTTSCVTNNSGRGAESWPPARRPGSARSAGMLCGCFPTSSTDSPVPTAQATSRRVRSRAMTAEGCSSSSPIVAPSVPDASLPPWTSCSRS
jgi:hypothetical protein